MQGLDREFIKKRKEKLQYIINGLKDHEPFHLLLEEKKEAVKFSDANWHLIDINDKDRLLELKYNKLAAERFVNAIDELQQELDSYDDEDKVESYYDQEEYSS